jgi:hypothetical protein
MGNRTSSLTMECFFDLKTMPNLNTFESMNGSEFTFISVESIMFILFEEAKAIHPK